MARSERFNIDLTATDAASQVINQVAEARDGLAEAPVNVEITAEDDATEVIEEVAGEVDDLDGTTAETELSADDQASDVVEDVTGAVEDLDGATADAELSASDDASGTIDDVTDALETLDGESASPDITLSGDDESDVTEVTEALAALTAAPPGENEVTISGGDAGDVTAISDALDDLTAAPPGTGEITLSGDDASDVTDVTEALTTLDKAPEATASVDVTGDEASDVTDVTDALSTLDKAPEATASLDVAGDDEAADNIGSIMDDLGTLGAGLLTGAAAGALTSVFSGAADNVLAIQNLATATGDTLEQASGIVEQFDFVGVSAGQVETMVGRVNAKLEKSPELAGQLGLKITDNMTPLDVFIAAVDALNSDQISANDKLSIATEIFGRKGALSVLAIGTQVGNVHDAIEQMPEWQVVTQADIDSAIAFKQAMDEFGDRVGEAAQQLLQTFGPAVASLITDLSGVENTTFGGIMNPDSWKGILETHNENTLAAVAQLTDNNLSIVKAYTDLGGSVESLKDNFFHLGEVQKLLEAGVRPEELAANAALTAEAMDFLGRSMADTNQTAEAFSDALKNGSVSIEEWRAATADGVITLAEVEAAVGNTDIALAQGVTAVDSYAAAFEESVAAIDAHKEALQGDIDLLDEHIDKLEDQAEAIAGGGDAVLDLNEAERKAKNAVDAYNESLEVSEDDTRSVERVARDQQDALDDVTRSYVRVADETVNAAEQQAAANGTTLTAIQRTDTMNSSLLTSAATLRGPMQTELIAYILRINGIPEERITEITADNNPNALAEAERELNNASRSRNALIQARIDQAAKAQAAYELELLTTPRSVFIQPVYTTPSGGYQYTAADGSPFTNEGVTLVGEDGPELVRMPRGAAVFRADQTDEMMRRVSAGGGAGGTTINMTTLHMPAGTASSYVNQIRRYVRRNGSTVGQPIP